MVLYMKDLYVKLQINELIHITKTIMKLSHTDKETIEQCTALFSIMLDQNYYQVKNVHKPHKDFRISHLKEGS